MSVITPDVYENSFPSSVRPTFRDICVKTCKPKRGCALWHIPTFVMTIFKIFYLHIFTLIDLAPYFVLLFQLTVNLYHHATFE